MGDHGRTQRGKGAVIYHTIELLALAVWVGGLIVILAALIPEVFNLGMESGGRLLTRVFARYSSLVLGASVVLVGIAVLRTWLSLRGASLAVSVTSPEWTILGLMVTIAMLLALFLVPESVRLQEAAFTAEGEVAKKTAHEAFFRSHKIVRSLYVANLGLGIFLIALKINSWLKQRTTAQ